MQAGGKKCSIDPSFHRDLARVLPFTGTPVLATLCSGLAASVAALFIRLEVLVEMMSIGEFKKKNIGPRLTFPQ